MVERGSSDPAGPEESSHPVIHYRSSPLRGYRRKGVQPDTGKTYIMRGWRVYIDGVCTPLCVMCEHSIYSSEKKAGDEWRVMREVRDCVCTLSSARYVISA